MNRQRDIEQRNLAFIGRYKDVFLNGICNRGISSGIEAYREYFHEDVVMHDPAFAKIEGIRAIQAHNESIQNSFRDCYYDFEHVVAEGNKVSMSWRVNGFQTASFSGFDHIGEAINLSGTGIIRIECLKIAEIWQVWHKVYLTKGDLKAFKRLNHSRPEPHLTARESEVLQWIGEGKSNDEIAIILGISRRTVEKHCERIFEKMGVESRMAAFVQLLEVRSA